jgi:multidrug efflux system membrane fusion protein
VVPSAAIQSGIQGGFVWVIDSTAADGSGTARIQPVKVALTEGQFTILDGGLKPGQNVVVDGADRLRAGQAVIATAARQLPAAPATQSGTPSAGPQQAPGSQSSQAPKGHKP